MEQRSKCMGELNRDKIDRLFDNPNAKCETCLGWKVLGRIIVDGKPQRSCDSGEMPDTCGDNYRPHEMWGRQSG